MGDLLKPFLGLAGAAVGYPVLWYYFAVEGVSKKLFSRRHE
jgi:hypothetical protein